VSRWPSGQGRGLITAMSWVRVPAPPWDILTVHSNVYGTGSPLALSKSVPRTDLLSMWVGKVYAKETATLLKK
jgi:hypothetical protein